MHTLNTSKSLNLKDVNFNYYRRSAIRSRLLEIFNQATENEIRDGFVWYRKVHEMVKHESHIFKTTPTIYASVISALSPRNKWQKNLEDAKTVLSAVLNGFTSNEVKVSTFHANKEKAFRIANNEEKIDETSYKTFAFVSNIAKLDASYITVDVWHLRACFGQTIDSGLTANRYAIIQEETLKVAEKLGLKGYQLQAIVWLVVQRLWTQSK